MEWYYVKVKRLHFSVKISYRAPGKPQMPVTFIEDIVEKNKRRQRPIRTTV